MSIENEIEIPIQVGSELRIQSDGSVVLCNPEIELARSPDAADAVLAYRFETDTKEHVLRLLEPVAIRKYRAVHTHRGPHVVVLAGGENPEQ
jgi:hypothetical protein